MKMRSIFGNTRTPPKALEKICSRASFPYFLLLLLITLNIKKKLIVAIFLWVVSLTRNGTFWGLLCYDNTWTTQENKQKKKSKTRARFFLKERMRGNAQKRQDVEKKSGEEVDENERYVGRMGEGRTNGCTIDLIR